jgi:uncharacterized membrane protein YbhN (UPF0104 family)
MPSMPRLSPRTKRIVRAIRLLLFPAVVVGVFVGALPHVADLEDVWRAIAAMSTAEVALLFGLAILNVLTYLPLLVVAMPGLSYRQALLVDQTCSTVAMTIPGGGAVAIGLAYSMYTSWGFGRTDVGVVTVSTGIANFAVKLGLPLAAVALVAARGEPAGDLLSGALVGVGVLAGAALLTAMVLRDERAARWVGRGVGRAARLAGSGSAWDDAAGRFRSRLVELLRARWLALVAAALVSQLSVYLVLLASLRFVGIPDQEIGWEQALAVFALVRLASAVPIIPGNVGLAELGYIGGLFRFLTYVFQIPLGGFTYAAWRRGVRRADRDALAPLHGGSPEDQQEGSNHDRAAPREGRPHQGHPGAAGDGAGRHDERPAVPAPQ